MVQTTNTNNPYAYTGRELDDTDLYYYRARYYDPTTQRFLSQDPIGFASGDFNFYRYVGNSPTYFRDPSGENPYFVYLIFVSARIVYIGITKSPRARELAHLKRWPNGNMKLNEGGMCKTQARNLEQKGIETLKNLENKINSISPKNPKYKDYMKQKDALQKALDDLVKNSK